MRLIDTYFRAFIEYRKHTQNNNDATRARRVVKQANRKDEVLTITKYTCMIEEEWIKEIEEGLIYIEKAIFEERQFIRTDGEVVNIEKVKKTSKDSVEHLSKNSNFITRLPEEGEMLIPDKLYIVEKLSDYAVYENRFLYLLLQTLKDFLYTRISRIKSKVTSYHAEMNLIKEIKFNNRDIDYNLDFKDSYNNDPYLTELYYKIPLIDRLEEAYYLTEAFLRTPLMIEVSKASPLKPPVTKTNVLRMNPNFRIAMSLYEYLNSYTKDGYEFKELKKTYNPLQSNLSDEIAEMIELSTFLIYSHGNDIIHDLKAVYDKEQIKLELLEEKKRKQELFRLKKRVKEMGLDLEEYILVLEKVNRDLEKRTEEIVLLKKLNEEYQVQIKELTYNNQKLVEEQVLLNKIINDLNETIILNNKRHEEEIHNLKNEHLNQINDLEEKHINEVDTLIEEHLTEINALEQSHLNKINEIETIHYEELNELKLNHQDKISELNQLNQVKLDDLALSFVDERISLNNQITTHLNTLNELRVSSEELIHNHETVTKEYELKIAELTEEKNYTLGMFYSLKQRKGVVDVEDHHTTKEKFRELEVIKKSFERFFNEQWRLTKQEIRANIKKEIMNKPKD